MNFTTIVTHGGIFHADDVMCVAMARVLNPSVEVLRVFKVPENVGDDTIVADIGFGQFDHHQEDAVRRPDGEKRAACGLLYEVWKEELFRTEEFQTSFERTFIIPIEDTDNGVSSNPLSAMVRGMNPTWRGTDADTRFNEAVDIFVSLIRRQQEAEADTIAAEGIVSKAINASDGDLVILDQFAPWQNMVVKTDAKLVCFMSNRGQWTLQCVPVKVGSFQTRISLPSKEEMAGCTFCHPGRFIAAFDSKESALAAAHKVLALA